MSKTKVWCCTKNNFMSKQKVWCCTKSHLLSIKISWCSTKNFFKSNKKKLTLHQEVFHVDKSKIMLHKFFLCVLKIIINFSEWHAIDNIKEKALVIIRNSTLFYFASPPGIWHVVFKWKWIRFYVYFDCNSLCLQWRVGAPRVRGMLATHCHIKMNNKKK